MPIMLGLGFNAEISKAVSAMLNDLLPTVGDLLLILNTIYRVTDHILSLIRQSQMEGKRH